MRQIGTVNTEREAQTLVDYLLTQGIQSQMDGDQDEWAIWVREENQVDSAKQVLQEFLVDKTAEKFSKARSAADQIRAETQRRRQTAARRTFDMRQRWSRPLRQRAPLVMALIGLSIFATLATGFGRDSSSPLLHALMFSDMRPRLTPGGVLRSADPLAPIKHGQVWRMVTPIFLHADVLHLLFNMWWLYALGAQLETRQGTVRLGWLVLVLALASNWAQFLIGQSANFMGMSGVVYGLFGYLWMKLKLDPREAYLLGEGTVIIMLLVLVLGFAGLLPNLANWAHLGGLLAGGALAYAATNTGRKSR